VNKKDRGVSDALCVVVVVSVGLVMLHLPLQHKKTEGKTKLKNRPWHCDTGARAATDENIQTNKQERKQSDNERNTKRDKQHETKTRRHNTKRNEKPASRNTRELLLTLVCCRCVLSSLCVCVCVLLCCSLLSCGVGMDTVALRMFGGPHRDGTVAGRHERGIH